MPSNFEDVIPASVKKINVAVPDVDSASNGKRAKIPLESLCSAEGNSGKFTVVSLRSVLAELHDDERPMSGPFVIYLHKDGRLATLVITFGSTRKDQRNLNFGALRSWKKIYEEADLPV